MTAVVEALEAAEARRGRAWSVERLRQSAPREREWLAVLWAWVEGLVRQSALRGRLVEAEAWAEERLRQSALRKRE